MTDTIQYILTPVLLNIFYGLLYGVSILFQRHRYAKQSDNHVLIEKRPIAGKMSFELVPIEEIGGQTCVRFPRKGDIGNWPIHILSEISKNPVAYPINKIHFVQTTIDSVLFLGDDIEPVSLANMPIVSARQTTALIQGVTMATDEVQRNVRNESLDGKISKPKGLMWVYISLGIVGMIGITDIVLGVSDSALIAVIAQGIQDLLSAGGLR